MKWVASLKKRKKKTDKIENVDDHLQGNEGINEPVYLNVYDISHLNTYFYWTGIGIYHSGVEGTICIIIIDFVIIIDLSIDLVCFLISLWRGVRICRP